jgi:hypothetical protein
MLVYLKLGISVFFVSFPPHPEGPSLTGKRSNKLDTYTKYLYMD